MRWWERFRLGLFGPPRPSVWSLVDPGPPPVAGRPLFVDPYTKLPSDTPPTYHDLHVTTARIARISIFDLPFGYEVRCNRLAGWELVLNNERVIAGEYDENWLVLDIGGYVICDGRARGDEDDG